MREGWGGGVVEYPQNRIMVVATKKREKETESVELVTRKTEKGKLFLACTVGFRVKEKNLSKDSLTPYHRWGGPRPKLDIHSVNVQIHIFVLTSANTKETRQKSLPS